MRLQHVLQPSRAEVVSHRSQRYLALLDLDSYSAYLGPKADHLDLEAHLAHERQTLTAVSWIVPDEPLLLSIILASDDIPIDQHVGTGENVALDGWIRTTEGRLSLTSAERLHAAARDRHHQPTRQVPGTTRARTLVVPAGTYGVHLIRQPHHPPLDGNAHQTLILRHYPPPAPRLMPHRGSGGLIPWAGEEIAARAFGGRSET